MKERLFFLLQGESIDQLFKLLIFSILVSLLEVIGVGIIMPFVNAASDFNIIKNNYYYQLVYHFIGFETPVSFIVFFGLLLVFFYLFRSIMSLIYSYILSQFSQRRYAFFANALFDRYLHLYYMDFLKKNSTHMVKAIINESQNLSLYISNLLLLVSEVIIAFFIYLLLMVVNWKVTLMVTLFLSINIIVLIKIISPRIKEAGNKRDEYQKKFYELLGAVFGNYKLLKLRSIHKETEQLFYSYTEHFKNVNITHSVFSQVPRFYLEALGFSLISFIVLVVIWITQKDISSSLSLITFFLLGLLRLLPSANRILSSYNNMLFYAKSVDIIMDDLHLPAEKVKEKEIVFQKEITLKDISFKFDNTCVLQHINLSIGRTDNIAFVGESGSGKSTLVDIIIGLHYPKKGQILIDGAILSSDNLVAWRRKIGYIPQHIYLFEGSVAMNVAMRQNYNAQRVEKVLKQAKIFDFLQEYHNGIETNVGENGSKLSGGQKQRIAIARALYNDPEILVLDEATSALDEVTEEEIMKEIYRIGKEKTLIIVTHRLSTIRECNRIIRVSKGKVYEDY